MAEAVEHAMQSGKHLLVEAPTGVGKTLAYLVPSVLLGRRVLISTHTKNLQDQLLDKDLPRLQAAFANLGIDITEAKTDGAPISSNEVRFAVMKGRSNYLCLDRIYRKNRQGSLSLFDGDALSGDIEAEQLREIEAWAKTSRRGDRSELVGLEEHSQLWGQLDARSETCHGSRCQHYRECFVTRMREEGERAELVVVNHHLLLSDLALRARSELAGDAARFGQVLPDADVVIIDEAHTIEAIASEHFGGIVGYTKLERLIQDVTQFCTDQAQKMDGTTLLQLSSRLGEASKAVFAEFPSSEGRFHLIPDDTRWAGLRAAGDHLDEVLGHLSYGLESHASLDSSADGLARRTEELKAAFRFVLRAEDEDYVYWAEGRGTKGKLGASPVHVSRLLERFLFERFESAILTSATLSAGDRDFGYFRTSIGFPDAGRTLGLEAEFDYEAQAALVVPSDAPEPDESGAEQRRAELTEQAIVSMGGGALVLCTSNRSMHALYKSLKARLVFPCFIQGTRPKRQLLTEFTSHAPAVLFATQSFWEGVDIPGDALRLVVVDRLPFDVPSDPLVLARAHRLTAEGRSPFAHDQLPRAILRLKQGFGRLIRTRSDRGAVVVLDGRVTRKRYGQQFLKALPPARRLGSIKELELWWRDKLS